MTDTRTAVVTGAARGIGAGIAKRLAADGFAVAVVDKHEASCQRVVEAIRKAGGRALAVGVDVADWQAVRAGVERIARELGEPTVLVNSAGILQDNMLFKIGADELDAVVTMNLRGSLLMTRAVQGYMTKGGWGRIVNLASTPAPGDCGSPGNRPAKNGSLDFTKTLASELGRFGVTVNAIAPGFIETEMTAATAEWVGVPFQEFRKAAVAQIPVARTGKPEDIAHAVSFFASEGAGFVSGQALNVAGGRRFDGLPPHRADSKSRSFARIPQG